jgi:hypothetical protein
MEQSIAPPLFECRRRVMQRKRMWAEIANSVLSDTGDEGRAIREVNSEVAKDFAKSFKPGQPSPSNPVIPENRNLPTSLHDERKYLAKPMREVLYGFQSPPVGTCLH